MTGIPLWLLVPAGAAVAGAGLLLYARLLLAAWPVPSPTRGRRAAVAVDRRLARARRETRAAVRRHQAALRRFPSDVAVVLDPRRRAYLWAGERLFPGLMWGVVLGLVLEALTLVALHYVGVSIRSTGL